MTRHYSLTARVAAVVILALATLDNPAALQRHRPGVVRQTSIVNGRLAAAGEVLVKYRRPLAQFERAQLDQQTDADESHPVGRAGLRRVHSRRFETAALLAFLRSHPDVEYAEPNYIITADAIPNDTQFGQLWGMRNTGQTIGFAGTPGADISAAPAWDISTGSRSIVVGITDTGIDYTHPDLAANMWTAPAPFSVVIAGQTINCPAGTHGFNAITKSCDIPEVWDDNGHGTHVAGTIGALGNNGIGAVGVNWATTMMASKFLDATGSGTIADAIDAVDFVIQVAAATGVNVRVLNNSWSSGGFSQALLDQINIADAHNMLFVTSAGNTSPPNDNDAAPRYPSGYNAPNVVTVASTDNKDQLASDSNYGATTVHLAAPGVNVVSTYPDGLYQFLSGTSTAAPHVAGAAALLLSTCTDLSNIEVKNTLFASVDPIPLLTGRVATGGRLNVNKAIRACMPNFSISAAPPTQTDSNRTGSTYRATITPSGGFTGTLTFTVTGLPPGTTASFDPTTVSVSGWSDMTVTSTASTPSGSFPLTIIATSGSGPSALAHSTNVTYVTSSSGAPVATADVATTREDTPVAIAVVENDSDADGDVLNVTGLTVPGHGTAVINADNTITYTPVSNYNGTDTFSYTIDDGHGGASSTTVSVTMNAVNDAPSFTRGADQTALEDSGAKTVAGWATAVSAGPDDEHGQALEFIVSNDNNSLFSAQPAVSATGTLSYTPAADANGAATVMVRAHDSGGTADGGVDTSAPQTFTITVTAVNDAPTANDAPAPINDEYVTLEDVPLGIEAPGVLRNDWDVEPGTLSMFVLTTTQHGSLEWTPDGAFFYTPDPNYNGFDNFKYRISDGTYDSDVATATIEVRSINDPPVTIDKAVTTSEDTPALITLTATDVEHSELAFTIVTPPAHGTLTGSGSTFTYLPAANYSGGDGFTYRASDGADDSTTAAVGITVAPVNDPPLAADDTYTTAEDERLTVPAPGVLGNDTDIDDAEATAGPVILAWDATFDPTVVGYIVEYGTAPGVYTNSVDVGYTTVWSTTDLTPGVEYYFAVLAYNAAGDRSAMTNEVSATGPALGAAERMSPTASVVEGPAHGALTMNADGSFTYTPAGNYGGPDSFTYKVIDGNVDSNVATVTITVTAVNDAPVAERAECHDREKHGEGHHVGGDRCRERDADLCDRDRPGTRHPERHGAKPHLFAGAELPWRGQLHVHGERRHARTWRPSTSVCHPHRTRSP